MNTNDKNCMFSHKSDEWGTPQDLFDRLNLQYKFDVDVSANKENAKCQKYYTMYDNALIKDWGKVNWCNPPYSKVKEFAEKASTEQKKGNMTIMLIPSRTDTIFFHKYCYKQDGVEIIFLKGRLKFVSYDGSLIRKGASNSAPFPSMLVIFNPSPSQKGEEEIK